MTAREGRPRLSKPEATAAVKAALDLRLAAPACLAWAAAWVALGLPAGVAAGLGIALGATCVASFLGARRIRRGRWRALAVLALSTGVAAMAVFGVAVRTGLADASPVAEAADRSATVDVILDVRVAARAIGGQGTEGGSRLLVEGVARLVDSSNPPSTTGRATWALAFLSTDKLPENLTPHVSPAHMLPAGTTLDITARAQVAEPGDRARALLTVQQIHRVLPPSGWRAKTASLKARLAERASLLPPDEAGLIPGLSVGDTSQVPPSLAEAMKRSSLTHLTAVSGTHLGILVGAVLALGALARWPRWVKVAAGAAAIIGLTLVVGPTPSVQRSAVMGAITLLALARGSVRSALGALGCAACLLLVIDPQLARSYGFALSCAATAGIVVLGPRLAKGLIDKGIPRRIAQASAIPIAAQAACAPILVLFVPQISLAGLPANILAAPAVPFVTLPGLIAAALGPVSPQAAGVALAAARPGAAWIARVARSASTLPAATISWPSNPGGALLLAALLLLLALGVVRLARSRVAGRRAAVAVLTVLGVGVVAATPLGSAALSSVHKAAVPSDWVAAVCDVGQGTGVAIRAGPATAILVDAGPDNGAMARCLSALGVRRIDTAILTHLHADHSGGLPEASRGRTPGLLLTPISCGLPAEERRIARLHAKTAALRGTQGRWTGSVAGVDIEVWPSRLDVACAHQPSESAVNDASLAVHAQFGPDGLGLWILGDLEQGGQRSLSARLKSEPTLAHQGGAVVVAHHGSSRQDPGFASVLGPTLAVMSSGQGNSYGHPARSAIVQYRDLGAHILRTDECGTVVLTRSGAARCLRL